MPRSLIKVYKTDYLDLFGAGRNLAAVARETGIAPATLYRYRHDVDKIRLGDLRRLVKALGLTDEQLVKVVRG